MYMAQDGFLYVIDRIESFRGKQIRPLSSEIDSDYLDTESGDRQTTNGLDGWKKKKKKSLSFPFLEIVRLYPRLVYTTCRNLMNQLFITVCITYEYRKKMIASKF